MGWAAPEVSSDELENLRCFLCCDISVLVPCEFAADVDTKVLGRSDSLKGSAMEIVLGLYWSSFPYKGDGLTLGRVELHEPVLFPFLDTVKVGLECVGVMHSLTVQYNSATNDVNHSNRGADRSQRQLQYMQAVLLVTRWMATSFSATLPFIVSGKLVRGKFTLQALDELLIDNP